MSAQVTERAHRMVVGLDGSPPSFAALEWAAGLADLIGSVSGHCAAHADSPVLVIRDRDRT